MYLFARLGATNHGPSLLSGVVLGVVLLLVTSYLTFTRDRLLASFGLAFLPTLTWFWLYFSPPNSRLLFDVVTQSLAFACLFAFVIGAVGYATGRSIGMYLGHQTSSPTADVLLGRNRQKSIGRIGSVILLSGALVLLLTVENVRYLAGVDLLVDFLLVIPVTSTPVMIVVTALWVGVSAWNAYTNDGLLVSVSIVFWPVFAAWLSEYTFRPGRTAPKMAPVALVSALIFAVGFGLMGHAIGSFAYRRIN